MGQKARRYGTEGVGLEPTRVIGPPHFEGIEWARATNGQNRRGSQGRGLPRCRDQAWADPVRRQKASPSQQSDLQAGSSLWRSAP